VGSSLNPIGLFKALKSYSHKRAMAKDGKGKEALSKDCLPSEIVHL
jgi:hypothetical protein